MDDSGNFQESAWISREYWYISESYFNLNIDKKADKYRKKSNEHLTSVSLLISDADIRKDYIELPLIHKLIRGEEISSISEPAISSKSDEAVENSKSENKKSKTIFSFCPECGFNNSKQFKFCPQCGSSLESK